VVPVVHDLIAFRGEPHDRKAQWIERMTLRYAAISARLICTVSEATKADLLKRYRFLEPSHVTPVFAGPMRATAPLSMPDDRTILCIATLCPRKNQKRLIEAYALLPQQLREKYQLVLVGARGWRDQDIVDLAKHTSGVRWMDYVDGDTYEKLLSTCTVFALPSLYEGFGMQILDALQRGIPVLASDRGSLREVCGNAAFYVDPEDPASISSGLQTLLSTSRLRLDLRERALPQSKLFSWERTTDLLLSALQAI
jgi:glycosyltransferase involved in cell wall biosynthesis